MNSRNYGPPRNFGPGDLALREIADEEEREERDKRRQALDDYLAEQAMLGDFDDED